MSPLVKYIITHMRLGTLAHPPQLNIWPLLNPGVFASKCFTLLAKKKVEMHQYQLVLIAVADAIEGQGWKMVTKDQEGQFVFTKQ